MEFLFCFRNRQHLVHEQRICKPHNIDTLAEINAYRPKAQNIYNRPETIIQKHPIVQHSQGGATGGEGAVGGSTYHNNDSYHLSQDSLQLVHLANSDEQQPVYELISGNHRSTNPRGPKRGTSHPSTTTQTGQLQPFTSHTMAPPFILPGMNVRPISQVYHTNHTHDNARSWPSQGAVYYNDMGEETPLYQEI